MAAGAGAGAAAEVVCVEPAGDAALADASGLKFLGSLSQLASSTRNRLYRALVRLTCCELPGPKLMPGLRLPNSVACTTSDAAS